MPVEIWLFSSGYAGTCLTYVVWVQIINYPSFLAHFPGQNFIGTSGQFSIGANTRRITERLEIHYTPKHGSWLDMAEIEIGVMARQCLDWRIPDQDSLKREIKAWQDKRNQDGICVNWRFTTQDARVKLKSLYPTI